MTGRERAALVHRFHTLAEEALNRASSLAAARQGPAVAAKERGRAEAFRLAADMVERGLTLDDLGSKSRIPDPE